MAFTQMDLDIAADFVADHLVKYTQSSQAKKLPLQSKILDILFDLQDNKKIDLTSDDLQAACAGVGIDSESISGLTYHLNDDGKNKVRGDVAADALAQNAPAIVVALEDSRSPKSVSKQVRTKRERKEPKRFGIK